MQLIVALCRSWDKICVVLRGSQILFYKDSKTFKSKPEDTFKGEAPVDLVGGTAEVATDYTKKKHVFRLKYVSVYICTSSTMSQMMNYNFVQHDI